MVKVKLNAQITTWNNSSYFRRKLMLFLTAVTTKIMKAINVEYSNEFKKKK